MSAARRRTRRVLAAAVPILGLAALWCALWGQLTLISVVTGVAVGILVRGVFYLPPVHYGGRVRVRSLLALIGLLLVDVVRASFGVAWMAVRPGPPPANAVLAVPLRARSDVVVLTTAELLSLVPGSLIVEIDRDHSVLYVHAIDVGDRRAEDRVRRSVRDMEARVIRAVGSSRDRRRLDAETAAGTGAVVA